MLTIVSVVCNWPVLTHDWPTTTSGAPMTTTPDDFAANARRAESVLTGALDSWKTGLDSVTNQFRAFPSVGNLPHFDASEAVERPVALIPPNIPLQHHHH